MARVPAARRDLKEAGGKTLARRTETAYKAHLGRVSLQKKAKPNTAQTP